VPQSRNEAAVQLRVQLKEVEPALRRTVLAPSGVQADDKRDSFLEWLGGPLDPAAFSSAGVNADLQRIR
jgi:hypothetical protein